METLQVGDLVESLRGRDKEKTYVVVQKEINNFVLVVDGETKKLISPKRKNAKHLKKLSHSAILNTKFANKSCVYDSEIFSLLKKFKSEIKE